MLFLVILLYSQLHKAQKTIVEEQETKPIEATLTGLSVEEFVHTCLEQTTKRGLLFISQQGGYYDPPEQSVFLFLDKLPYYYYQGQIVFPDIEKEFNRYLGEKLPLCFQDFKAFKEQGIMITPGIMHIHTMLQDEQVQVKLTYPLTIKTEQDIEKTLNEFNYVHGSKIRKIEQLAQAITQDYMNKPGALCLSCLQDLGPTIDPELSVDIKPVFDEITGLEIPEAKPDDIFLVSITDHSVVVGEKGFLVYRFALQNPDKEKPIPLQLKDVPDTTVRIGEPVRMSLEVTGDVFGRLTFSDKTDLFDVYETTGTIVFTPKPHQKGKHLVAIEVHDQQGNSDMDVFAITVQ